MNLEKIYKQFGKVLPDRSTFRATSSVSFRDVINEYKSWTRFANAYAEFVAKRKPALKVVKKVVKNDEIK